MKFYTKKENLDIDLKEGIAQLTEEYPISLDDNSPDKEIIFNKDELSKNSYELKFTDKSVSLSYSSVSAAFRALAKIFTEKSENISESSSFETLGFMIDCSRNAVMTVETIKTVLRRMALMGYNVLMLYTEDTYEIPNQPFFGYLRGAYTHDELKELDDYAYNLGIEMVPCIQTIGHLEQILKWEAFGDIRDTEYTLLPGEEKTYKFIEDMINAVTSPLRSKRIHIGMDEARMLGSGVYKARFGERDNLDLMTDHMKRVYDICKDRNLKPMIWSDCFFRRGKQFEGYYDTNAQLPEALLSKIPEDIQMVHWDYWHYEEKDYTDYIDLHRNHGREPIVAPGAIASGRFWCGIEHALKSIVPCVQACKQKGIKEILLTTWGDDGAEADFMSTLATAQLLAESAYSDILDRDKLSSNFNVVCGAEFDDYLKASHIDIFPSMKNEKYQNANCAKWLLWDDPMLGLCEPYHENEHLSEYYSKLACELYKISETKTYGSLRLCFPAQIAKTLSIKVELRKKIVKAYHRKNRKELSIILKKNIPELIQETEKLWKIHRNMWLSTYKPFGWEVIDKRYGGLLARINTLQERIRMYLEDQCESLPEFETELLKFRTKPSRSFMSPLLIKQYGAITTPSTQK